MKLELSREENKILKGFAIWGIILHNFCHWLPYTVKESEFTYNFKWAYYMWDHIVTLYPTLVLDLLSYFGHYGVPVFVFLSGYGVVKKYEKMQDTVGIWPFMRYNGLKLLKLMLPAFLLFMLADTFLNEGGFRFSWQVILEQLTFTINLFPDPNKNILPGPYWFFGLTMQLYLVYRLLFYRRGRSVLVVTVVLSLLIQAFLLSKGSPESAKWLEYVRYNFIGSLLPFCMGIYAARYEWVLPKPGIANALCFVLLCGLIMWGCYYKYSWLLVPALWVMAALTGLRAFPAKIYVPLQGLGAISAAVFAIHPTFRPLWLLITQEYSLYLTIPGYLMTTMIASWLYHKFQQKIPAVRF